MRLTKRDLASSIRLAFDVGYEAAESHSTDRVENREESHGRPSRHRAHGYPDQSEAKAYKTKAVTLTSMVTRNIRFLAGYVDRPMLLNLGPFAPRAKRISGLKIRSIRIGGLHLFWFGRRRLNR
jgi:hypothetical protein